jgi:thiamine-phosphate pyrophosphorylase
VRRVTLSARAHLAARIRGFYAILDADDEALATRWSSPRAARRRCCRSGSSTPAPRELLAAAQMARRVTRAAGALLIVNDRLDVALAADADGVHLGQDDLPLAAAIHALGAARARMLVGISTHDLAQVAAAVAGGADYLGFGPVFPTATKANPDPVVGLDGLRAACARAGQVPVVAIGGVGVAAAAAIHAAGAAAACAISAVNGAADRAAAAQALALPWRTPLE